MQAEIEAKWLDINPTDLRAKLKQAGASLVHPERLMRRYTFDDPRGTMSEKGGWARVRDEGERVTMSYKQLHHRSLHGTHETTLVVDSFERAKEFLEDLGLVVKAYQETKRELWKLGGGEVTLDTWPWIPTFVEIEAPDEASLKTTATMLGLDWKQAMYGSVETAYQKYYTVSEEEIDHWPEITFIPTPDWLTKNARI